MNPRAMKKSSSAVTKPNGDEKRREDVLRGARKVFELHGLEGASMRMIAFAARCTTGSIYPYFKGKEEIYAELLSRSLEEYRQRLAADVERATEPAAKFEAVVLAHFDHYVDRPEDMSLALYLFNGLKPQGLTPELDARLNQQLESIMVIFRGCVLALGGVKVKDADAEVGLHYSVLFGLLILHHTKRTRVLHFEPRQVLKFHINNTVQRLARGPHKVPAARKAPRRKT